jgi:Glycine rich protein
VLFGLLLAIVLGAPSASASGSMTSTFTTPGESTFTVPAGVTTITVDATGGQGGGGYTTPGGCEGGAGASVTGTLAVTAGEVLYVEVGGAGGDDWHGTSYDGGVNGGGAGGGDGAGYGGGGGGGATDVRTLSAAAGLTPTDSRLLVAGGGGGGGEFTPGCTGGAAGSVPAAGGDGDYATGGQPGTQTAGGSAGTPNGNCTGPAPGSGGLGTGGSGQPSPPGGCNGGGGGGGGFYGGGGGGAASSASGGGAGSSYLEPTATGVSISTADQAGDSNAANGAVTISYTVAVSRPSNTAPPAIAGTAKVGASLACGTGSWANGPTSYLYQWSRDGTPIAGATNATHTVQAIDEGNTLTCAVAAVNSAGAGVPVTSAGILVPVPVVAHCPGATGTLSGQKVGLVKLGDTRKQAQKAYTHSSNRGTRYEEFFCLTPIGVRVGYASPKLLDKLSTGQRSKYTRRVDWISTASAYYAINGIRPGATIAAAAKKLKIGKEFRIGLNDWYLAPAGSVTAILKGRGGIVEEIGIADKQLTKGRTAQRRFLTSFS